MKNKGKNLATIDTNDPTVSLQIAAYKKTKRGSRNSRTLAYSFICLLFFLSRISPIK